MFERIRSVLKALVFVLILGSGAGAANAAMTLQIIPSGTTFNNVRDFPLRITLTAFYRGPAFNADFYFGIVHPDGVTASFIVNLNPLTAVVRRLDGDPRTFPPLVANVFIPADFQTSLANFFVHQVTPQEPPGTYNFFAALTAPRAFDNGLMEGSDMLALDMQPITITAPGGGRCTARC